MSADFMEKVVLLAVTALLTGFGAPVVLRVIDERRSRAQKLLDAEIARQATLIQTQAALLDSLAKLLWRFQMNAIEVSYYHGCKDTKLYTTSLNKYEKSAGDILGQIRAEISRSMHLTSSEIYEELKKLYYEVLLPLDVQLRALIEGKSDKWHEFNRYAVDDVAGKVDRALNGLAQELRLKAITAQ